MKKISRWIARQGDVLIERVSKIPAEAAAQKPDGQRVVLAYGEVTGHAHAIPATDVVRYGPSDDAFWLDVHQDTAVTHEEHGSIALPVGTYKVTRQMQYTPAAIERVAD